MRVQLALSALKIKSWPFPGRIALRERHLSRFATEASIDGEFHVLDHWAYLGSARCADELAVLARQRAGAAFDVDVYKILLRYFSNHPKLEWHDLREKTTCA
jgi:DNA polymerase-3 subunit epsilon